MASGSRSADESAIDRSALRGRHPVGIGAPLLCRVTASRRYWSEQGSAVAPGVALCQAAAALVLRDLVLGRLSFQAVVEVRRAVARQHLVDIRFPAALALPELLGPPLLGGLAVFGRHLGRVHQLLRMRAWR